MTELNQTPQRVSQLSPWLKEVAAQLKRIAEALSAIQESNSAAPPYHGNGRPATDAGRTDSVTSQLARALLIAQQGERFEPAVMQAIRNYRFAHESVAFCEQAEIDQHTRQELVARLRWLLSFFAHALKQVGVDVHQVATGERVDPTRHKVDSHRETQLLAEVDTIAEVRSPLLTWTDDQGNRRVDPAVVVVYVRAQPRLTTTTARDRAHGTGSESTTRRGRDAQG